jgi:transducin (beta)-like 1
MWDLPRPLPSTLSAVPDPVTVLTYRRADQADFTSMNWNKDGTLLATSCYDSAVRIFDTQGNLYMRHNRHEASGFLWPCFVR